MKKPAGNIGWQIGLLASAAAAACAWAPAALADDGGTQASLGGQVDTGGQLWTVSDLQPSADVIAYAPAGSLWEATATVAPVGGGIPMVPGFAARAGGDSYPVLWPVPTAQGINPSSLPAGGTTTGKLYFDVVGAAPNSVVYTAGGHDAAVWVAPPPAEAPAPAPGGYTAPRYAPVSPVPAPQAVTPVAPVAPAPAAVAPAAPAAPAPAAGSSGTPAPASTPAPAAGSSGTPASAGAPAPASTPVPTTTPAPTAGSSGTPASAGASTAPTTTAAPAAGAAENPRTNPAGGSAGTPASPALVAPTTTPVPVPAG
jgi:hypothetical protein